MRDNQDVLLQYVDVAIAPDTQIVNLNFALTPGTDYRIRTNDSVNTAHWDLLVHDLEKKFFWFCLSLYY
ncbi:MAG: hypothetical protein IPO63_00050 [Bacteroidetes bacterium]|nr:hypothetical protein [Bacteroidota bacterium]